MTAPVFETLHVPQGEFARATGWESKPEGLCLGDRCVPFPTKGGRIDVRAFAALTGMAIAHDEGTGLWAVGPESGGHALATAVAPELELPDLDGRMFRLSDLRGSKVFLHAWASW